MAKLNSKVARVRRHKRLRSKMVGTAEMPRLAVFRSLKHINAQFIDDVKAVTLLAVSDTEVKTTARTTNIEIAKAVGKLAAEKAAAKGITTVVFDRGGNAYHGRVKALAEGAREQGLKF